MARAKVVEFDYYQFLNLLRRATDTGARVDKADPRWAPFSPDRFSRPMTAVTSPHIKETA